MSAFYPFYTVGGAQYRGGVQYRGGYHEYRGGYLEYRGGVQFRGGLSWVPWGGYREYRGVFSTVGDIMSTVEGVQYCWEKNLLLFEYPAVLNSPHGTHDIPPWYSNFKGWYLPRYWTPSTVLMISPRASWYPPRYWTSPMVLKITPTLHMTDPPTVLNTPTVLKISPTVLKISPTVLNTPHGTEHPHGTAHTLYRVSLQSSSNPPFFITVP